MAEAPVDPEQHRVNRALAEIDTVLDDVVGRPTWSMRPAEQRAALVALARVESRVAALRLALVSQAESDDVGAASGATSSAAWHADATGQTPSQTTRLVRRAGKLDARPSVAEALGRGDLRLDQAEVIADAVDALPADLVDQQLRDDALAALLAHATGEATSGHALNAPQLRRVGARILESVAPEVADEHLRRTLEAEERRAAQQTRLTMSEDGHGCVHGRFTLPVAEGAMLRKALHAIAAPKHQQASGGSVHDTAGERKPRPLRLGEAFCEYVSRYGPDDLAVLGGRSRVLDVGRARRFHTPAQRLALHLEQRGCTAQGCDWPPGMCHVHHTTPWSRGGGTNTRDARLLCPRHHARAHDPAFRHTLHPDGSVSFHRRT